MQLFGWLNFLILNIATIFCWYLYVLSVQPAHRAERFGEKAWIDCKRFRFVSGLLMGVMVMNLILWLWFPIDELAWPVHPNPFVGIIIGITLALIFTPIWVKGILDAGMETMEPTKSTKMYGGIYNYIRHPQALGEMPWWIIIPLFLNSLVLVFWSTLMIIVISPIIIYFEEKDLVKRFGQEYIAYQQRTGAIIPKWRKPKD